MASGSARVFFALWPDAALRSALAELAREVAGEARGRPTAQENLHLTLAFLGDQSDRQVQALQALAGAVVSHRFQLALDEIGSFARTGIAWLGASAPQLELVALQGRLAHVLREAGFSLDERPYAPHLTLVRRAGAPVRRALARPILWNVTSFVLAASDPGREPIYRVLAEWALDPG